MELLKTLNPEQLQAVIHDGGPLLVLAGAGSGKTKVLTHRAAWLVTAKGVSPAEILLLTFTNKASEEMLRKVGVLLSSGFAGQGGTFHSFSAKILRRYANEAGLSTNFVIYDSADQIDVVKEAMAKIGVDVKSVKPNSVLAAISEAKNELIAASSYEGFARGSWTQMVAKVYLTYQQLLKRYQALDFDDLLFETVNLLKKNPEIRSKTRNSFKHVLIDEYQDTNKAQYEMTKLLTGDSENLTVVGDASQAIYSWRGADYRNLLLLKQDFVNLTIINLEQNYRSTQIILSAANEVIRKNKNHPILNLWTSRGAGEKITVYEAESEIDEASFVVAQLSSFPDTKLSDFAVLYRTNAQSRVFEEAMLHAGIPYALVGGVRFYERKEIKDVLAYLKIYINPADEVSRKRAEKLGKGKLSRFESSIDKDADLTSLQILDLTLKLTGYLDGLDPADEEDAGRMENLKELRSVADLFPNLNDFLQNIALTEKESKKTGELRNGAVTLMTMHSAKGLEFRIVFIVGMEEGLFPHSRSLLDPDQMEEERRLAYVGITRAMDKLYITYAKRRLYFGQRNTNPVSRFLAEIPEILIDTNNNIRVFKTIKAEEQWGFDDSGNWKWKPD